MVGQPCSNFWFITDSILPLFLLPVIHLHQLYTMIQHTRHQMGKLAIELPDWLSS
jgi:hypothetical protein